MVGLGTGIEPRPTLLPVLRVWMLAVLAGHGGLAETLDPCCPPLLHKQLNFSSIKLFLEYVNTHLILNERVFHQTGIYSPPSTVTVNIKYIRRKDIIHD